VEHPARRERLSPRLAALEVDAFLVTRLPNVRYLTGFTGSNGALLMRAGDGLLVTDGRYDHQSAREVPDLRREITSGGLVEAFARACGEFGLTSVAFEATGVSYATSEDLARCGARLVPTRDEVERLRRVKDPAELASLRAAQAIADEAFDVLTAKLVEGVTEREAALELDLAMRRLGAEGVAFETIVAFGPNAAEPHHEPTARPLARGDVVKLDFGAVVEGYHSDMTRTVSFGGPLGPLREVYDVVHRAHAAGVAAVRPGVTGGDVDRAAREVVAAAGHGGEFTHGLGHGVGLEIHEAPALRPGGQDVLGAGEVVTVEPGVYVAGLGGVRIEDMVEVTADGGWVIPTTTRDLVVLEP
jgi:Xaa-Pro aminopeptidase